MDPVAKKGACSQAVAHLGVDDQGEQGDEEEEEARGQAEHHMQRQGSSEEQDLKKKGCESVPTKQPAQGPG